MTGAARSRRHRAAGAARHRRGRGHRGATWQRLGYAGVECVVRGPRTSRGRLHTWTWRARGRSRGPLAPPPVGQPAASLAQGAGVECRPGDPLPTLSGFDVGTGLWLTREDVEANLTGDLGASSRPSAPCVSGWARKPLRWTGSKGSSPRPTLGGAVAESTAGTAGERRGGRRRSGRAAVAEWLWTQDEYDDSYFGDLPRQGYAPSSTPWPAGSTSASTGRWSGWT